VTPRHIRTADGAPAVWPRARAQPARTHRPGPTPPRCGFAPARSRRGRTARARREAVRHGAVRPSLARSRFGTDAQG